MITTTLGTAGCYLYFYWIAHCLSMATRMMMHDYDDAWHSWMLSLFLLDCSPLVDGNEEDDGLMMHDYYNYAQHSWMLSLFLLNCSPLSMVSRRMMHDYYDARHSWMLDAISISIGLLTTHRWQRRGQ